MTLTFTSTTSPRRSGQSFLKQAQFYPDSEAFIFELESGDKKR